MPSGQSSLGQAAQGEKAGGFLSSVSSLPFWGVCACPSPSQVRGLWREGRLALGTLPDPSGSSFSVKPTFPGVVSKPASPSPGTSAAVLLGFSSSGVREGFNIFQFKMRKV